MPSPKPFREILIFVAGATPQIITETIYALAMQNPPVYPDELHIITHSQGRSLILQKLVKEGKLKELCTEYGIPRLTINESSFLVIKGDDGKELPDIRTAEDNEPAGDQIAAFIREKIGRAHV